MRETGEIVAAALGAERGREFRVAGAVMSMDEAVSYALANVEPNGKPVRAWQLSAASEPLQLIEPDDPAPGPEQLVVDVRAAGICHSDVGFLDGTLTPMLAKLPLVLGHEVAGVVSEVGPGVDWWAIGNRVVAFGDPQQSPGWLVDGGFADKFLASTSGLVRLPDAVDSCKPQPPPMPARLPTVL